MADNQGMEKDNAAALSPETSPTTAPLPKKGARRVNSRPKLIGGGIIIVILITFGSVAVSRSTAAKARVAERGGRSAMVFAKDITSAAGQAGVVNPRELPPSVPLSAQTATPPAIIPDQPPKPEERKEPAALRPQEPPKPSEEVKKAREKRIRQFEAALDGPIKVQLDEIKGGSRSIADELARVERQLAELGGAGDAGYAERLAAARTALDGSPGAEEYDKRNDLSRMNQFGSVGGNWKNAGTVEAPATRYIIRTGSVIPATLVSGINSDLPGQIVGQVAQDVYDTPTGKYILIPQGSRLVGEYSSQVQYGQSRVFAVWQRVVFPDGKALDLGAMPGGSGAGYAGFRDRVNNHYLRIFGSAVMMSAILAGIEMTQTQQELTEGSNRQRMSDALSESLGQVLGGVMAEMLQKNMNIAPALEIRPGYRLNVMLVKDLEFTGPYKAFDYVDGTR